jgi:hypothetical protein
VVAMNFVIAVAVLLGIASWVISGIITDKKGKK